MPADGRWDLTWRVNGQRNESQEVLRVIVLCSEFLFIFKKCDDM